MALDAGNIACTSGLAKAIYDARVASGEVIGIGGTDAARAGLKADSYAIASAVVAHITANAVVLPTLLVAPPNGGPVTGTGGVL